MFNAALWSVTTGHLENDENPGQTDCHKKCAAHSEGSSGEAEAEKSKCFWKSLEMKPNQDLQTLEKGFSLDGR